jgi:hypothetical protein
VSPRRSAWRRDPLTGEPYRDSIRFRAESPCGVEGCAGERRKGRPVCDTHWRHVPDDLRDRLRWALDGRDAIEVAAARRACIEAAEDVVV